MKSSVRRGSSTRTAGPAPKDETVVVPAGGVYVGIAALGISALAAAAASSLASSAIPKLGFSSGWLWLGAVVSAAWAGSCLFYAIVCFRKGTPPATPIATRSFRFAALAHVISLLASFWIPAEGTRYLDLTVASLLLLELAVIAALAWHRLSLRQQRQRKIRPMNAWLTVGSMFAVSIVVSAIATVGLSASTAGHLAVPHSAHGAHHPVSVTPDIMGPIKQSEHHRH